MEPMQYGLILQETNGIPLGDCVLHWGLSSRVIAYESLLLIQTAAEDALTARLWKISASVIYYESLRSNACE